MNSRESAWLRSVVSWRILQLVALYFVLAPWMKNEFYEISVGVQTEGSR